MSDIFISYSKADHALALKLSAFLESEGWTVWWDKSLAAADLYRDEIMKQLAAARAVITIWTENSVKSDWVRAEAGRAKADGKLIPVKTSELTYADIPLPFGEMHTENVGSTDLIRAAIVAQLAKPAVSQSPFWQITSTFKYQILTWIGIIGSAITLFANLNGVLTFADRVRDLVAHWQEWNQLIWGWVFHWINLEVPPKEIVPIYSFFAFCYVLVIGLKLRMWHGEASRDREAAEKRSRYFALGGILLLVQIILIASVLTRIPGLDNRIIGSVIPICSTIFTIGYLLYLHSSEERPWVLIASLLVIFMGACLVLGSSVVRSDTEMVVYFVTYGFQVGWMGVIFLSPLQELTRRLAFVVLGVLTLIALSEISKLNLDQYLHPATVSESSSPTHNVHSHAAA